jgi:hypothetical protein
VRFYDDFVLTFQYKSDALLYLAKLKERLEKFKLELHSEKTRLIEWGRFAIDNYKKRNQGKASRTGEGNEYPILPNLL